MRWREGMPPSARDLGEVTLFPVETAHSAPLLAEHPRKLHLVVGDLVALSPDASTSSESLVRVKQRLARTATMARANPKRPELLRTLAANVDQAVVVTTAAEPPFRAGLVERMIIGARHGGVEPVLVINKIDLDHDEAELQDHIQRFEQAGVSVFPLSVSTGKGFEACRRCIEGNFIVLVGHSGVGKSSFANRLEGMGSRGTGAVRRYDGKGRHTTTRPQLTFTDSGTVLIDTPGIRSFALAPIRPDELWHHYPEFEPFSESCKYRDCAHVEEPGCAVREAYERGTLHTERYRAYLQLYQELKEAAPAPGAKKSR